MCKTRILFLGLFSAICITGNAYSLDYNNPTIFLNNNTKAEYQLAKSTFLPDSFDDLGLSGHENTKYDHNQGDNCTGYELTTCPAHGNCLSCSFNRKLKRLVSCASGYTKSGNSCSASSCSAAGYESSIPANKICTKFTEGSLTCYKDCRTVSCSAYTLNCDTFNVANSSGKTMCPDCESANASCSPKLCKVSGCQDGYKISSNGTTCVALDDTCPNGYFKSCDTGTTGTPEYTEKGTACYQCKPKPVSVPLAILYSDLTTAKEVIAGKTPIGVVYDEAKKLAVALTDVKKAWSTSSFDVPGLTNCDQYNYVSATHKAIDDLDGKKNTSTIIQYCKSYNKSCPAAEYAYNYKTEGTNAGDWYLGATSENTNIFSNTNRSKINSTLRSLSSAGATELAYGISAGYWHSTESTSANAWYTSNGSGSAGVGNVSKTTEYYVRPIINYGDVQPICISEAEVQKGWENGEFLFRTPVGKKGFCNPVLWEKTLCEDKTTKIFACSRTPEGPGIEYENGYLTTRGAIGWIKSLYCAGANKKSQCLSNYSSVILSPTATSELRNDINGENFSKYITDYHFNKNVCDWCLDH